MSELWLVRHAQASIDADEYDCLSEHGRMQSKWLGEHLRAQGFQPEFAESGTLSRQRDTLSLALAELGAAPRTGIDAGWNELDAMAMLRAHTPEHENLASLRRALADEPEPDAAFVKLLGHSLVRWQLGELAEYCQESWPEFRGRVTASLSRVLRRLESVADARTLIVTSGGVIATVVAIVEDVADAEVFTGTHRIANAAITRIVVDDGEPRLTTFNDSDWLAAKDPTAVTWR